jgi:DNA-binding beta-propeller fold protein YncE
MIPNITISGMNPVTSQIVTTTLSSDTLSYVAGLLTTTDNKPVNITVPEANTQIPAIVSAATQFVLPGTTLGIFPVGLIITSAWTALFILAVGYGTFGRMRFRDHYRRRVARAQAVHSGPRI